MFSKIKKSICRTVSCATFAMIGLSVSADQAGLERGEKVFNEIAGIGCVACHGEFGEGDLGVGPYIRGATDGSIRAAISGIDAMVVVRDTIDEQGIKDVVEFVQSLGSTKVIRTLSKRGRFLPQQLGVQPGTSLQIVVNNGSFSAHTFKSEDLGVESLSVAARKTGTISWKAPDEEGEYKLYCLDCKLKDQFFIITVGNSEK